MSQETRNIVIYGVGAIGGALAGWLAPHYENLYLLTRGDTYRALKSTGLILYEQKNDNPPPVKVNVIKDLNELSDVSIVIITVKNYNLEEVCEDIRSKLGDTPIIVALQNGVANQQIIPKYFSKVIYGVIMLSAWRDAPGLFGYGIKGYLMLGTLDNLLKEELKNVKSILKLAIRIRITDNYQAAIHNKIVFNLVNSIFTLVNTKHLTDKSREHLSLILLNCFNEAIEIVKTAGIEEHSLPGFFLWDKIISLMNESIETITKSFTNMINSERANSMKQDVVWRSKTQTEIEDLNGYLVKLAEKNGVDALFNSRLYDLCKKRFNELPFVAMDASEVWKILKNK